jgi:hypothetical protein
MQALVGLMMEEDKDTLVACWTALGSVINSIPKELQPSYVRTMREAVQVLTRSPLSLASHGRTSHPINCLRWIVIYIDTLRVRLALVHADCKGQGAPQAEAWPSAAGWLLSTKGAATCAPNLSAGHVAGK